MTNNRRITQIYPNTANHVRLTYRNDGFPVFQQGDRYGDAFRLSFGQNNYGDEVDRGLVVFYYHMIVQKPFVLTKPTEWEIDYDYLKSRKEEVHRIFEQKPKIDELINTA